MTTAEEPGYRRVLLFLLFWAGLLVAAFAFATLVNSVWYMFQNVFYYQCQAPIGEPVYRCPGVWERVGWQVSTLITGSIFLAVGVYMTRKGRKTP